MGRRVWEGMCPRGAVPPNPDSVPGWLWFPLPLSSLVKGQRLRLHFHALMATPPGNIGMPYLSGANVIFLKYY